VLLLGAALAAGAIDLLERPPAPRPPDSGHRPGRGIETHLGLDARQTSRPPHPQRERGARGRRPAIRWRNSRAIGEPANGRLVRGVLLPPAGEHFFTWDPVLRRRPNRAWRRWGTDDLVRLTLRVIGAFAEAHPAAPRVGIGDLSRRHGGDFGPRFGYVGHATHQNGLDADIYYPRIDRRERAPDVPADVDLRLAQDLLDRFVRAGAVVVYVGPNLPLHGPPGVVVPAALHDDHLHVRIAG
jgi:hypothetical protein